MPSILFKPLNVLDFSPEGVRGASIQGLGTAALETGGTWEKGMSLATAPEIPKPVRDEWLAAMAREWLLHSWILGDDAGSAPEPLASVPLFPDEGPGSPRLAGLAGCRGAATMIPLDHGESVAAALYAIETSGSPDGTRHIEHEGVRFRIDLVPSVRGQEIGGDSWELAAYLCARIALHGSGDAKDHLAREWAATGRIDGARVKSVEIGSKFENQTYFRNRNILVPRANLPELHSYSINPDMRGRIYPADDMSEAIASIEGNAPKGGDIVLPAPLPVMHALVGGAWQAAITPILLLRPQRLVLWHSEDSRSKNRSRAIKDALADGLGAALGIDPDPDIREISSDDLSQAWDQLYAADLVTTLDSGEPIVFNITSGNRIMAMAVFPWAQRYPSLTLVYRDIDAEPFGLTTLRFNGLTPVHNTFLPEWANSPPSCIGNWKELWERAGNIPVISGKNILESLMFSRNPPRLST